MSPASAALVERTIVEPVFLARAFRLRVLLAVATGALLVLAAGFTGTVPAAVAVAVAVGMAAVLPAAALFTRALLIRASASSGGACRGAGLLGVGVLAGGLAATAPLLVGPVQRPEVAVAGLTAAAATYLSGLLLLPGVATTVMARLRRGFDGLSIGISVLLAGWLVLPEPDLVPQSAYTAVLVASAAVSVTAVTVLRAAARQRAAALRCGGGAALAILGLAVLAVATGYRSPALALAAAVLVVVGPTLTWAGVRRSTDTLIPSGRVSVDGTFAGYPMLALPVGAAVVAGGYHLIAVGPPDHTAVLLAMGVGVAVAIREVLAATDVRRYARRLACQEAHFRALVAGASDVTMVLADDLVVRWQVPAVSRQLGLHDLGVVGRMFTDLVHPDDVAGVADRLRAITAGSGSGTAAAFSGPEGQQLIEARMIDGFGRWRDIECLVSDQRDVPEVGALVVHVRDVGERRHLERTLHRLVSNDQLTGLANRRELMRTIVAQRGTGRRAGALLVLELHGVTGVNDQRGREVGDAVLVEAALRLRTWAGPDDLVARLGGAEFAVVTTEGPIEAYALGVRLLNALAAVYQLPGGAVHLEVSVGLTALSSGDSAEDVAHRGDLALRLATQRGRNRIEWYDECLEEQLARRMDLERELPGAGVRGEFDLAYQPVLNLSDGRPVGLEALLRWRHPTLGTVLPGELVPIADKLRLSGEIGQWALHVGCRQLAAWLRDGHDVWLAVNVSGQQLLAPDFVSGVAAMLNAHDLEPERLVVEIAEAELGDRLPTVITQLGRLRAIGVRTALDDFGAGHTPLGQLRRLPLDLVKIECGLGTGRWDGRPSPLIKAAVDVAQRLGLEIVAERLEQPEQLDQVREAGCHYGQGYLVAHPAPAERVEAYLESYRAPSL